MQSIADLIVPIAPAVISLGGFIDVRDAESGKVVGKGVVRRKKRADEEDKELWRKLYKAFIFDNEELDALLEDISLYWNDDKAIVDTFVVKTIKRFKEENGAEQELLPEYKDDEDIEYAHKLFRASIQNAEEYRRLMSDNSKNWDMNRLAFMDVIIMQTAIAEVLTFPQIPVNVSINEYVEIAKYYSTPKSGAFINGLLDSIIKNLKKDNRISK